VNDSFAPRSNRPVFPTGASTQFKSFLPLSSSFVHFPFFSPSSLPFSPLLSPLLSSLPFLFLLVLIACFFHCLSFAPAFVSFFPSPDFSCERFLPPLSRMKHIILPFHTLRLLLKSIPIVHLSFHFSFFVLFCCLLFDQIRIHQYVFV
jgi:hypothetical protein